MGEFKFSCQHCGQNIQCDEQWAGQQIACPACSQSLIIPQFRPVAIPVPAAPAPPTVGQAQVVARPAKAAPKSAKKIVAWTVGSAVLAVAIYFGLKLADNWQTKFNKEAEKAARNSGGGEMVHIAKLYETLDATDPAKMENARTRANLRAEREEARMAEELKPKPDPTLALPVVPPAWTLDVAAASIPKGRVNGSSGGTDFHVETVRMDRTPTSAVLAFQEGAGSSVEHSLIIYLPANATENLAGRSWTVAKEAKSKDALPILKRWTVNPKFVPSQKTFSKGYAMKLELDQPTRDWQPGRIFLALPDTNQTVLAGEFSIAIPRKNLFDMAP
jgi:DNA-directed RNA polymerase subunit RPC12/RpoP